MTLDEIDDARKQLESSLSSAVYLAGRPGAEGATYEPGTIGKLYADLKALRCLTAELDTKHPNQGDLWDEHTSHV